MGRSRVASVFLLALAACTSEAADPLCPAGTSEVGGICKRGCTSDGECLLTESCDLSVGVCKPRGTPPPPGPAPTIVHFWVAPETITEPGQTVSVYYEVENATEVEITPNVLARTTMLSQTIFASFEDTTTITLTAYGEGEVSAERTVVLSGGGVGIQSFTASPSPARAGDAVTLAWKVVNEAAGTIRVSDPVGRRWLVNAAAEEGQLVDTPRQLPIEYWIEATGANGLVVRARAVVLPAADAPRIDVFEATPSSIHAGDTALVRWETAGGTGLSVMGPGLDDATNDPFEVARGYRLVAPTSSADYGLVVQGPGDQTATDRAHVDVQGVAAGSEPSFTVATVEPGRRSQQTSTNALTVRWETAGADHVSLYANGGLVGDFGASDRRTVPATTPQNVKVSLLASSQGAYAQADLTSFYVIGEAEPNDSAQQADPVDDVARLGFVLINQIDLDWYSIDVPEGGRVEGVLVARGSSSCDATGPLAFELVGPDASTVLDTGSPDASGCPHIAVEHLGAGRHYFRVGAGNRLGEGAEYVLLASALEPRCGDGVAEGGEQCDDGNRSPGDGCDGLCAWESGPGYDVTRRAIQSVPTPLVPPVPVVLSGDAQDPSALLPIPFAFTFYGHQYAGLVLHASGYVSFRPSPEDAGPPAPIPSGDWPNAVIAALWGDVVLADFSDAKGEVLYWPRGLDSQTAHPRLDILYRNLTARGHTEENHALVDVVVSLESETNIVRLYYGQPKVVGQVEGVSFVAGIEDDSGAHGEVVPGCAPGCDAGSNPAGQLITFTPR